MELIGFVLAVALIRLLFLPRWFEGGNRDVIRIRWRVPLRHRHGRAWWLTMVLLILFGALAVKCGW